MILMYAARVHGRRDGRPRTERTTAEPLAAAASSQQPAAKQQLGGGTLTS